MYKINKRIFNEVRKVPRSHLGATEYIIFDQFRRSHPEYTSSRNLRQADLEIGVLPRNSLLFEILTKYYGKRLAKIPFYSCLDKKNFYIVYPASRRWDERHYRNLNYTLFYHDYRTNPMVSLLRWCRNG